MKANVNNKYSINLFLDETELYDLLVELKNVSDEYESLKELQFSIREAIQLNKGIELI